MYILDPSIGRSFAGAGHLKPSCWQLQVPTGSRDQTFATRIVILASFPYVALIFAVLFAMFLFCVCRIICGLCSDIKATKMSRERTAKMSSAKMSALYICLKAV